MSLLCAASRTARSGVARFSTSASASAASRYPPLRPRPPILKGNVYENFAECVGNTPLVKLKRASELTGCNIYGKCEFMNPGGSVKDRAGLYMVMQAEAEGKLIPGEPCTIVEGTAGNTGIGLTLAANSRGYRTIIVIPETQSQEKKDTLRYCGAHLIEVPAFPYKNPQNYVHIAARLAKALQESPERTHPVFYANQWDNTANRLSHLEGTGPEILAQLDGKVDAFSCAMGTGGTLSGTATALRKHNPNVFIGLTDPQGAVPTTYYQTGEVKAGPGSSVTEGIGQARITGNMAGFRPDKCWEITDTQALDALSSLCIEEGLQVGLSSGINVAGAMEVAKHLGPGHNIVTVLCDGAMRYATKMYNLPFLRSRSLPVPTWLEQSNPFPFDVEAALKGAIVPPESFSPVFVHK